MRLLDLTLPTPAENLSLDEALLEAAEAGEAGECLRLWESREAVVVVGRSCRVAEEIDAEQCRRLGVPILRRVSGGGTIVTGPGCLMYAVVLSIADRPGLKTIDGAHAFVLDRVAQAVSAAGAEVHRDGTSDLVLAVEGDQPARKISGNSVRLKRDWVLYHGTLMYDFDLALVSRLLRMPPRQPDYRAGRGHDAFVANAGVSAAALRAALAGSWQAARTGDGYPEGRVNKLVAERYSCDDWNLSR